MSGIKRNVVTSVPTTLQEGHEVFYNNNGTYTHYIGNASNEPVPAKGYLELSLILKYVSGSTFDVDIMVNDFSSTPTITKNDTGKYDITITGAFTEKKTIVHASPEPQLGSGTPQDYLSFIQRLDNFMRLHVIDVSSGAYVDNTTETFITIKVYP
jgi:hypothetical protein